MDRILSVSMLISGFLLASGCEPSRVTDQSVPRDDPEWVRLHDLYSEQARTGSCKILFLGDSITQGWGNHPAWQTHFAPKNALHFGIGGDGTQHFLFRIENGEIGQLRPKAVIVLIGTNNLAMNDSPADIAAGVGKIVESLRRQLPKSDLFLLGLLPRGLSRAKAESQEPDPRVPATNALLKKLADNRSVFYLDFGPAFLDATGRIPATLMPDFLHLSDEGYERFAECLEPCFPR